MLDFLIDIPGMLLRGCNAITHNYVLALFLFAVVVELLMLPLSIKQQKNQIRQAKLRPKEEAIRSKYKGRDDKATQQKIQNEIMEMYQRENFNPMQGCLPLLIQFPIILALYQVVINPLRYICRLSTETITAVTDLIKTLPGYTDFVARGNETINQLGVIREVGLEKFASIEGFAEKITSLDDLPNFSFFGGAIDLAQTPSFTAFNWLLLIPVLTFLISFFSTRITRRFTYQPTTANDQQAGCSNAIMDVSMPLLSVYITFIVPGAIGVYWMFKNIVTMLKQIIIAKVMPIPVFTEEDYRAAEREAALSNRARKKQEKAEIRSLHHIDDEEEDTPNTDGHKPTAADRYDEGATVAESDAEAKQADGTNANANTLLSPAPLKEDKPPKSKKDKKTK